MKLRRFTVALALVALVAAVTTATSVARSTSSNRLAGLPNTCHTFGKGKYVIASDLPLQGSLRPLAVQIVAAIRLELKQMNFKIGDKTITYASCDDSTAAKGSWDSQTCTNNANGYKTVKNFLGLIGTFNSGCAEIIAPILNRAPGGGIAMVSPANTYVGLTKPTGVPGEPGKYFPSGKRNYAPVKIMKDWVAASPELQKIRPQYDVKTLKGNERAADGWTSIALRNAEGLCGAAAAAIVHTSDARGAAACSRLSGLYHLGRLARLQRREAASPVSRGTWGGVGLLQDQGRSRAGRGYPSLHDRAR